MKKSQIALQLYTLRDHLKTPGDMAATFRKVRAIGYEHVQASGLGPISENDLTALLRDAGLSCCATHEPPGVILDDPRAVVDRLKKLNVRHTAYPFPAGIDLGSLDSIRAWAARLDASGRVLREGGHMLGYHNHHVEFRRIAGRTILEWIYELTDPANVVAELDTYWVQYGGGDPAAWCRKMKGRMPCVHLKDYGVTAANTIDFAEIGQGNLDWPAILCSCDDSGVQWFIVEQDTCPGDPFESIRKSYDHLVTLCT